MDRLQLTKDEIGVIFNKLKAERIKRESIYTTDYNMYRKLSDLLFKTFDTYSRLDRKLPDTNFNFVRGYYKSILSEAEEITKLLENASNDRYRCLIDVRNRIFEESTKLERWYDIDFNKSEDEIECHRCRRKFSKNRLENHFYWSNTTENNKMKICKDCIKYLYNETGHDIKTLLERNDIFYSEELWETSKDKQNPIGYYLKMVFSLPQFKIKKWKDSI